MKHYFQWGERGGSVRAVLTAALILPALLSRAQPVPAGSDFHVNMVSQYSQSNAAVSMAGDGRFVVTWLNGRHLFGRTYGAGGVPQSGEIRIDSSDVTSTFPDVAMGPDGHFVVAWMADMRIFARRFADGGTALGPVFQVSTEANNGPQYYPDVAVDSSGRFVVVWTGSKPSGTGDVVYARRYDADGAALTEPLLLNTQFRTQQRPAVDFGPEGRFIVTWYGSSHLPTGKNGIFAQWYDAAGAPFGAEFRVNTSGYAASEPDVSAAADGQFAVVWTSEYQDGSGDGVFGRLYGADGEPMTGEIQVHTTMQGGQRFPSVGMDAAGRFVAVWTGPDAARDDVRDVYAQSFGADGTPLGGEFRVNDVDGISNDNPALAMAPDGSFVAAWRSYEETVDYEIVARRFVWTLGVGTETLPEGTGLIVHPPFPNPFREAAQLVVELGQAQPVRIEVFDALGRRVAVPMDGFLEAGTHAFHWEAEGLPAGLYVYRVRTATGAATRALLHVE